jgi:hypothetical protein
MVVTPTTVVSYILYAAIGAHSNYMLLTVPFVLYGVFRALLLIHHRGTLTEDPALAVWRDQRLLLCIALWGVTAAVVTLVAF